MRDHCQIRSCDITPAWYSSLFGVMCDSHKIMLQGHGLQLTFRHVEEQFEDYSPDPQERFFIEVTRILQAKAQAKGYAPAGGDGSDLAAFVERHASGHAQGEIIYKVVRWNAQKDLTDLVKIAAWAYLIWAGNQKVSQ